MLQHEQKFANLLVCLRVLPGAAVQGFWTDFTNAVDVFSLGEVLHGNTR